MTSFAVGDRVAAMRRASLTMTVVATGIQMSAGMNSVPAYRCQPDDGSQPKWFRGDDLLPATPVPSPAPSGPP